MPSTIVAFRYSLGFRMTYPKSRLSFGVSWRRGVSPTQSQESTSLPWSQQSLWLVITDYSKGLSGSIVCDINQQLLELVFPSYWDLIISLILLHLPAVTRRRNQLMDRTRISHGRNGFQRTICKSKRPAKINHFVLKQYYFFIKRLLVFGSTFFKFLSYM